MTVSELAGEAFLRSSRIISRRLSRATDGPQTAYISDETLRRSLGGRRVAEVASRIREGRKPQLTRGLEELASTVAAVKEVFPDSIEESRLEAEAILSHRINLFGGVYELGPKIDWHLDPRVDVRWPLEHYSQVPIVLRRGADIRVVWELNRLQNLVALGRAYALTGDERYTEEFLLQLASWNDSNPPRFGANWVVAMEVAIRAMNIIAALELFRGSPHMTDEAIDLILKMLLAHGRFIRANLEFNYRSPGNHYLSDLIGLFAIAIIVPEFSESRRWADESARWIVEEIDRQVLGDGVDYEGAIGYHRYVLEIFALFFLMSRAAGLEPPNRYRERLEAMFDFVRHYLKPDGTAPMIGDSDDGRLIKFKSRPADDHSYLMSIAAVLFDSEKFKQSNRIDEEAIWWFGSEGRAAFERLAQGGQPSSQAFPEAQIFVQRTTRCENGGPLYAIIDCGNHGARGHGSHAHSDALSLEVFAFNRTFLRDPGTFAYTASEELRNLFRSTAYHNTVRVDGEEISQTTEGELFMFTSNVRPRINHWESDGERDLLDAEHYAYRRLADPVTHRRIVTFDKRAGFWIVEDIFTGEGLHLFEFFFNFDGGLEVTLGGRNCATGSNASAALTIVPVSDHKLEARTEERWVSPAYGIRLRSSAIIYNLAAEVPLKVTFELRPAERKLKA
jgi:hypothetical protein